MIYDLMIYDLMIYDLEICETDGSKNPTFIFRILYLIFHIDKFIPSMHSRRLSSQ